jgi:hypothetical protein
MCVVASKYSRYATKMWNISLHFRIQVHGLFGVNPKEGSDGLIGLIARRVQMGLLA